MTLPRVGSVFHFCKDFEMDIVSGSNAKKLHIDPDLSLIIVANGETGPLMKVVNPLFFGRPVSQFSDRLVLTMSFQDLIRMKKRR